jgi:hypothetical protein
VKGYFGHSEPHIVAAPSSLNFSSFHKKNAEGRRLFKDEQKLPF